MQSEKIYDEKKCRELSRKTLSNPINFCQIEKGKNYKISDAVEIWFQLRKTICDSTRDDHSGGNWGREWTWRSHSTHFQASLTDPEVTGKSCIKENTEQRQCAYDNFPHFMTCLVKFRKIDTFGIYHFRENNEGFYTSSWWQGFVE